jgi:hypothetical protein
MSQINSIFILTVSYIKTHVLGNLKKLRKETIGFVMPVCLSVCLSVHPSTWNNSTPTRRIYMEFEVGGFLENV